MSIANLSMYDLPEVTAATDAWWNGIAQALARAGVRDVPKRLNRGQELSSLWRSPDLLLSQTCGYPLVHAFKDDLQLVATPVYAAQGCQGSDYCSLIIVRQDDPARELTDLFGRTAVITHAASQSGYSALRAAVAPLAQQGSFFGRVEESGGHPNSLAMVTNDEADVCAIDCVTHALLARHRPESVSGLRVIGYSPPAPGLPYVTWAGASQDLVSRLRDGLAAAAENPDLAGARDALLIADIEVLPLSAYDRIVELEQQAIVQGYARVA